MNLDSECFEGFSEPRSGIVGALKELNLESLRDSLEKPRSSRDVVRADDLRSDCCAISPEDEELSMISVTFILFFFVFVFFKFIQTVIFSIIITITSNCSN